MACVDDLPEEILEYILCLISPYNDLRNCRQVSCFYNIVFFSVLFPQFYIYGYFGVTDIIPMFFKGSDFGKVIFLANALDLD